MADEFRPINQLLGTQPKFGPFPAEQLVPWFLITLVIYLLGNSVFQLPGFWTALLIFWGCSSWWLLTGSKPWRFLSKFVGTPNWTRGRVQYHSIFLAAAQFKKKSEFPPSSSTQDQQPIRQRSPKRSRKRSP